MRPMSGQSLIEVIIAMSIGAVLLSLITVSVRVVLQSNTLSRNSAVASALSQELLDDITSVTEAGWPNIYNLAPKGAQSSFFLFPSGTSLVASSGVEYGLWDDVRGGLAGYWRLDEGSGSLTRDSSGNNYNGSLSGGTAWQGRANCRVGICLNFNGAGNVAFGNLGSFYSSGTIVFWLNSSEMADFRNALATKYNGGNAGIRFEENAIGAFAVITGNENGSSYTSMNYISSGMNINTWYHVAYVWDTALNTVVGYLNGVQVFVSSNTVWPQTMPDFRIGTGYSVDPARQWKGNIDDARLYNRSLSSSEINKMYKSAVYDRYFSVENVQRDALNHIVSSSGVDDPSTQKVTSVAQWFNQGITSTVSIVKYFTRWKNFSFGQSDWSGGPGFSGPVSVDSVTNKFTNASSNMDATSLPGSLKLVLP